MPASKLRRRMRYFWILICVLVAGCEVAGTTPTGRGPAGGVDADAPDLTAATEGQNDADEVNLRATAASGPQRTIAGLGDPSKPGLWLETPLVAQETQGQVRVVSTGATTQVTLIPVPGAQTAGSHLSLSAMRALNASLSDLIELIVTVGG